MADESWRAEAACRNMATAPFFTERAETVAEAKAVCADCPVREECGQYARTIPGLEGVWGGLDESDRRRLRRKRGAGTGRPRATTNACGTPNKYRRGGCRCELCTAAAAEACRVSKARAKGLPMEACPECGAPYTTMRLWQHRAITHGVRTSEACPECGEVIRQRGIARHMAAHRSAPSPAAQRKRVERARAREEAS